MCILLFVYFENMRMKNKDLYNQKNKEQLLEDLKKESFERATLSFYKYIPLDNCSALNTIS